MRRLVLAFAILVLTAASAWAYPATITASVNLRTGPGLGNPVITVLPRGATVDVRRCRGNWCEVTYRNWRGFVSQRFVAQHRPPSRATGYRATADRTTSIRVPASLDLP